MIARNRNGHRNLRVPEILAEWAVPEWAGGKVREGLFGEPPRRIVGVAKGVTRYKIHIRLVITTALKKF